MYLGVGIHKAFCQTTVMDESRTIVERAKVPTDREHLSEFFRRYSGKPGGNRVEHGLGVRLR